MNDESRLGEIFITHHSSLITHHFLLCWRHCFSSGRLCSARVLRGASEVWEQALWGVAAGWMLGALAAYALARWQGRLTWAVVAWATLLVWVAAAAAAARWLVGLRGGR